MFRRYSFFIVIIATMSGLTFWSNHVEHTYVGSRTFASVQATNGSISRESSKIDLESPVRKELFEILDRIVSYQHQYRSIYGNYTQLLHRIGIVIPKKVAEHYEIRIVTASKSRLLVSAFSERDGKVVDLISVNQDYEVISELPVVTPRIEYLQAHAQKHLRELRRTFSGATPVESGLFRGYFKYETRAASLGQRSPYAVGVKSPAEGLQIESELSAEVLPEFAFEDVIEVGEKKSAPQMSTHEEVQLAQKIFFSEMGRYAQSWAELSKITQFAFENKEKMGAIMERRPASKSKASFGKTESKTATQDGGTVSHDLEIEAISAEP